MAHPHDIPPYSEGVSDPVVVDRTTAIFSALSDPTRFRILELLMQGEMCVNDLAAATDVSASGVSHHLRLLKDRGLVAGRRSGQNILYSLADDHVECIMADGIAHALHTEVGGIR